MLNYDASKGIGIISILLSLATIIGLFVWVMFVFLKIKRHMKRIITGKV